MTSMDADYESPSSCCGWNAGGRVRRSPSLINEAQLSKELNELSLKEREQIFEELHGVAGPIDETPELVAKCLREMRDELTKISQRKRRAYDRAVFLKPSIRSDDKFHMMFLRADRFDPQKAASRMCMYFDHRLSLFGEDKLVEPISIDDIDSEVVYSGAIRLSSQKDRAGRAVLAVHATEFRFDYKPLAQYVFYQLMAIAENEDNQKHGLVDVVIMLGEKKVSGSLLNFMVRSKTLVPDLPLHRCGFHMCCDDPRLQTMLGFHRALAGKEMRLRERSHFGSAVEIRYALMTFGITFGDDHLRGPEGKKSIDQYIEERRQKEQELKRRQNDSEARTGCITFPNPADVLVGRGRPYQDHSGSKLLAQIVGVWADRYRKGQTQADKKVISLEIYERILQDGGRFLRRTDEGWVLAEEQVAREKINKALSYELRHDRGHEKGQTQEQPLMGLEYHEERGRCTTMPASKRIRSH